MIRIGEYLFYPDELLLIIDGHKTILTHKECKLLDIFSTNINNIIDRNRLLKEGWEDDGVITTRSLDMYVSRLRKKLGNDPAVRITNIHGKGYCLKDSGV
jgi:DNA-binding response OmpR family regulator